MRRSRHTLSEHEAVLIQVGLESAVGLLDVEDIEAFLAACRKLEKLGVRTAHARELLTSRFAPRTGSPSPASAPPASRAECSGNGSCWDPSVNSYSEENRAACGGTGYAKAGLAVEQTPSVKPTTERTAPASPTTPKRRAAPRSKRGRR
jgi:hypothetical protein